MSRLKKLTVCDLAQRIYADEQLKKKLVAAVAPLMSEGSTPELERRVLDAINLSLLQAADPKTPDVALYKVTCGNCSLDEIIQAEDWTKAGVSIECCVCGTTVILPFPVQSTTTACKVCGVQTTIKRTSTT